MTAAKLDDLEGFFDGHSNGVPTTTEPASAYVLPIVVPRTWFTEKPAGRAWLLRDARRKSAGVLPLGRVGQIIGEGGASKTMAAMQLAVSISTGVPWLGTFPVATKGRTLLAAGEEDAEEAKRRLYRVRASMGSPIPDPDTIVVLPLAGVPCAMLERGPLGNTAEAPFFLWLRQWVKEHGPWSLIIVDPLSRFAGPDAEIDNAAATRFVQALESIATETGATVLVTHHTNKQGRTPGGAVVATAGRGSSALVDGVRWQCSLGVERLTHETPEVQERLGELVTWSHTKSNYSRRAEDVLLRRDPDGGALLPLDAHDLAHIESARAQASPKGKNKAKRAEERSEKHAALDVALDAFLADNPQASQRAIRAALAAKLGGCSWDALADALARRPPL